MDDASEYDDHYARWSYEQLLLQQPHVTFQGLWRVGHMHYIVCPDIDSALTVDGKSLRAWFDGECRVMTAQVHLVPSCPTNAESVPERSASQRSVQAGAPRTKRELLVDLHLELSKDFPAFGIEYPGADVVLVTRQPLSDEERNEARTAYRHLGHFIPLQFKTDPTRDPDLEPFRFDSRLRIQGDIELIPSSRLAGRGGRALRFLVEDDEQAWVDSRRRLSTGVEVETSDMLPPGWSATGKLGCLVDVFIPENIRTYLSLYETVNLAMPLEGDFDRTLTALGIAPKELTTLVEHGRVRLLLPQAVDRYPEKWLSDIAERAPQNLLLSRRLAAATMADARRRVPLLFPPLSPAERYALLHALAEHAEKLVGRAHKERFVSFLGELGTAWSATEWSVQARGALGTSHLGVGALASAVYEQVTGRDVRVEIWFAAQKVEWGAALGAHVFPGAVDGYDETNACDLVAGLYGPQIGHKPDIVPTTALSAITEILAIDNRVSVVDFAKEFSSPDIKRLRDVAIRLARENVDEEFLASAIAKFNAEVRHYERRPDQLKTLNIVGWLSAGLTAANAVEPSIKQVVPLGTMLLGYLVHRIIDEIPRYSAAAGTTVDFLNSLLTRRARPDAVLVARTRKEIARFRK